MHWIEWALFGGRVATGGVLILAGVSKIAHGHEGVLRLVQAYRLTPDRWSRVVAVALPPVELAVGALIVLGAYGNVSAALGVGVLATVTVAAGSVIARGLKAPCGCFGGLNMAVTRTVIARNVFLIALLVPGAILGSGAVAVDAAPSLNPYVALVVVAGAALVTVIRSRGSSYRLPAELIKEGSMP